VAASQRNALLLMSISADGRHTRVLRESEIGCLVQKIIAPARSTTAQTTEGFSFAAPAKYPLFDQPGCRSLRFGEAPQVGRMSTAMSDRYQSLPII
jgi:hypothetical protein